MNREMKKAIVIGATSGIGNGLAKLLVHNNYKVGITGRRLELLIELKQEKPDSYFIKAFDVTDTNATVEKLEELSNELGGLDLLIISSGTGDMNEKLDFEIEKQTVQTNIIGFTCIADWAFNYFQRQKSGHLAAITSVAGLRGSRLAPSYNATKAYQINYMQALKQKATKLKLPVFITDVRPGFVGTKMAKGEKRFWVATVDKASRQIFAAIEKKKKVVYVSKRWGLVAAIFKAIPSQIYDRM